MRVRAGGYMACINCRMAIARGAIVPHQVIFLEIFQLMSRFAHSHNVGGVGKNIDCPIQGAV